MNKLLINQTNNLCKNNFRMDNDIKRVYQQTLAVILILQAVFFLLSLSPDNQAGTFSNKENDF